MKVHSLALDLLMWADRHVKANWDIFKIFLVNVPKSGSGENFMIFESLKNIHSLSFHGSECSDVVIWFVTPCI
jgi:hypothetical protein